MNPEIKKIITKISRNKIIRVASVAMLGTIITTSPNANAQVIGLAIPNSGKYQTIATQIKNGAEEAIKKEKVSNPNIKLVTFDDQCDTQNTEITTFALNEADIIIGPVCFETGLKIAEIVNQTKNVPVITLNTRNNLLNRVREYNKLPIYELSPEPDGEAIAIVNQGLKYFGQKPFAIIDDGSVHAKNLSDEIRLLAEQKTKKPIAVESFRPLQETQAALIKRLIRSGVEALIIAGSPEDIIVIVSDMENLNVQWPVIISEQAELIKYNQANFKLKKNTAIAKPKIKIKNNKNYKNLNDEFYEGHALTEIAIQAIKQNNQFDKTFDTIIGDITFVNGRANHKPFQILKWNGKSFSE